MTDMRRITISFDKDSERAIEHVRETDKCSYSQAVRKLILIGVEVSRKAAGAVCVESGVD